jgi:HAT1-interacting factor 1
LGQSVAEQKTRLEEAAKGANDLSGLVRKKKQTPSGSEARKPSTPGGNGKRAIESMSPDSNPNGVGKKPKLEAPLLDL